jgi:hypothetical protein
MVVRARYYILLSITLVVMFLWPTVASANMGIPYLAVLLGAYFWLLLPVILIEALVLSRRLSLPYRRTSLISTVANLGSAIVGCILLFAGGSAFWEMGFEAFSGWPAKIPFFIMFIPSYVISVWLETVIGALFITHLSRRELLRAFAVANVYSYALLGILAVAITMPPM